MPQPPRIVAIIAVHNEQDIIEQTVGELLDQGIEVYLLDHGSTDGSAERVKRWLGRGLIAVEPFDSRHGGPEDFCLEAIVRRKRQLALSLGADWYINADADEFRESPWPGVGLAHGIALVDRAGYNAIDFELLDFVPTHDAFEAGQDPRQAFPCYQPGASLNKLQLRCWKHSPELELAQGGHDARFPGRRVFPLRFLLRHYPLRGQAHAERKLFEERLPRFDPDEQRRGWHRQYAGLRPGDVFVRPPEQLRRYDPELVRVELALRHRGVEQLEQELEQERRRWQELNGVAEQRGGRLEALQLRLEQLGGELLRAGEQIAERDARLLRLGEQVAERDARLLRQGEQVAERDGRLAELGEQLAERDARLSVLGRQLVERDARLVELGDQLAEAEHIQSTLEERQQELERRLVAAREEHERQRGRLEQQAQALSETRGHVAALLDSRSWRWMAPLRAVFRLISGRRA